MSQGVMKSIIKRLAGVFTECETTTVFTAKLNQDTMRVLDEIVVAFGIDRSEAFRLGLALMHIAAKCSQEGRELTISMDGKIESVIVFPQEGRTS